MCSRRATEGVDKGGLKPLGFIIPEQCGQTRGSCGVWV